MRVQSIQVCPGEVGGWGAGGWGAHRVTHIIIKKCVTSICHNSNKVYMLEQPNCTQTKINNGSFK